MNRAGTAEGDEGEGVSPAPPRDSDPIGQRAGPGSRSGPPAGRRPAGPAQEASIPRACAPSPPEPAEFTLMGTAHHHMRVEGQDAVAR